MTALSTFVSALQSLVVTGVVRRFTYPPQSIGSADLPAQFINSARIADAQKVFQRGGGWPTLTAQLIIAVVPVAQNTNDANWDDTLGMVDALDTALSGLAGATRPAKGPVTWTITAGVRVTIAGVDYWCVTAEVTTYG
jgi:hypothetical protein